MAHQHEEQYTGGGETWGGAAVTTGVLPDQPAAPEVDWASGGITDVSIGHFPCKLFILKC